MNDVVDVAPRFRRIHLEGEYLKGVKPEPGEKVQVFLPGAGIGLGAAVVVERRPNDDHLAQLAAALRRAVDPRPDAALVMTGRAQAIQEMRARLGSKVRSRTGKTKAYWSRGREGLD